MDVRTFALFVFVSVLGSLVDARTGGFYGYPYGNGESSASFDASPRVKREVGDSNGETTTNPTTSQATTTTPSTDPTTTPPTSPTTPSTDPTTTPITTTDPTTTPITTTDPTTTPTTPTTPSTTTDATSPTTTPTTTSATTPTTTSATTPTTPSTSTTPTPSTMTPASTKPTKKPTDNVLSRSNFDDSEPEDSDKKPGPSSKGANAPTPGPYFGPGGPGSFGPGFDPYFGYPGLNSIPGPNYGWTGTNSGPGYASAGASAGASSGSFAGGYPGTGYPTSGFPSVDSRGGYQDNTPNQNGYGYGGVDPLYNAGSGLFFPGQYPNFNNDPYDMIRQIQAQIEAQHQAIARSMASNQWGSYASNVPNYAYSYASTNMNNMGHPSTFGSFGGVDYSNMDLHNRLASEAANYGGNYGGGGGVPQVASASIGLGPQGGYQMGQISPAAPGIESRFAEELPSPSGNGFGVFSSSSSSSRTGPDGKQINHKSSITGVNDNGKISYRTVHD